MLKGNLETRHRQRRRQRKVYLFIANLECHFIVRNFGTKKRDLGSFSQIKCSLQRTNLTAVKLVVADLVRAVAVLRTVTAVQIVHQVVHQIPVIPSQVSKALTYKNVTFNRSPIKQNSIHYHLYSHKRAALPVLWL